MSDRIKKAEALAREDGEKLRDQLRYVRMASMSGDPGTLMVDGSMYSPSWRALAGGAEVWEVLSEPVPGSASETCPGFDTQMAYEETLDRITDELGLYWEDGCLWRAEADSERIEDQDANALLVASDDSIIREAIRRGLRIGGLRAEDSSES